MIGYQEVYGLSVGPSGNVHISDGANAPALATYSPTNNSWSFQTYSGWSSSGGIKEVAAYKNFVFASDDTPNNAQNSGIVRFNSTDGSTTRFAQGAIFGQATLGLDGYLYGLVDTGLEPSPDPTIYVFNPDTLDLVRTFTLKTGPLSVSNSIAVDGSGNVFASVPDGGTVTEYDSNGNSTGKSVFLTNPNYGGGESIMNVAIDNDG